MTEHSVRSILRLIAVVTVLVGASLMTMTLTSLLGVGSTMRGGMQINLTGMVVKMSFLAVLAYGSIVAWGVVLHILSPRLARSIVE